MNLTSKISTYFISSSILVFAIIAVSLFLIIQNVFTEELDEQLVTLSQKATRQIKNGANINFPPIIEVTETDKNEITKDVYKNVLVDIGYETELFREFTTYKTINNKYYKITTRNSVVEKEDLIFSILTVTLIALILFMIVLFLTNKYFSKRIFLDFYSTLKNLEEFSLKDEKGLVLNKSKIIEFEQLNSSLLFLAEKAKREYKILKEFSEETNHELQTPISVIKSKLELLIQNSNLTDDEIGYIDISLKNLNKLERINKSILLLNKLDHKELFELEKVNIAVEIKNLLVEYEELIEEKNIELQINIVNEPILYVNKSLINILIANLISNSVKHNLINGQINIELDISGLKISNISDKPLANVEMFFVRFYKDSKNSNSIGLGLTIAKKICDFHNFDIKNSFTNNIYEIEINFYN